MAKLCWKEFTNSGLLVIRKRTFKTEQAMNSFIKALFQNDNFYGIVAFG